MVKSITPTSLSELYFSKKVMLEYGHNEIKLKIPIKPAISHGREANDRSYQYAKHL